jgi:hypothetical protein
LEFIQQTITRMASNSFLLKGWTVTIIAGLFAFANTKEMNSNYLLIALIPTFFFWFLDGFFLYQERLFRKLYDSVRVKEEDHIDFSMDTSPFKGNVGSWVKVCFSKTLLLFYFPVFVVIILAKWLLPIIYV